jgi:REP element-mobilizing transposase RayT
LPDHVHLLISLPNNKTISKCVKDLKGARATGVFRAFPELKLDAHTNNFWQRGYGFRVVPKNQLTKVAKYIETQHERPEKYVR